MFTVVLTVDRNAYLPSSYYPGPLVEVEETLFAEFIHAVMHLRYRSLLCLGVLEGHIEDENGERVEADLYGF